MILSKDGQTAEFLNRWSGFSEPLPDSICPLARRLIWKVAVLTVGGVIGSYVLISVVLGTVLYLFGDMSCSKEVPGFVLGSFCKLSFIFWMLVAALAIFVGVGWSAEGAIQTVGQTERWQKISSNTQDVWSWIHDKVCPLVEWK